jgi:phosphate:Na+ symporter
MFFKLIGGIGLFLMGMVMLSDGLKAYAGDALRHALVQFTGRPIKAVASGALITALVQSSSATTVTVIGFVSAGLLTFPQALGVVMGASLGTTSTGWIVSVLGLKVSVGFYALPLVGIGAFIRLLAKGRWQSLGLALAGFGLIFIGIETLQDGMEVLSGRFDFSRLPPAGFFGDLVMMAVGAAMTVVMQSSSAAMATTLTALHTQSINFEQAASLVIGAAVGTTVTGALAAIGASVSTKRTALAHVLFNLATGIIAVISLPVFLRGIQWAQEHMGLDPGAVSLAAFHTSFIAVGVIIFLPFVDRFSRWVERLLPEKEPTLIRHLDPTLLNVPSVALEATRRALQGTASEMFRVIRQRLGDSDNETDQDRYAEIREALSRIQDFFAGIPAVGDDQPLSDMRVAQMHAIDHLVRLRIHLIPPSVFQNLMIHKPLKAMVMQTRDLLELGEAGLHGHAPPDWMDIVAEKSVELAALRRQSRPAVLKRTAGEGGDPALALGVLDAMRWLDRVGYHAWRIVNYLGSDGKSLSGDDRLHPDD